MPLAADRWMTEYRDVHPAQ